MNETQVNEAFEALRSGIEKLADAMRKLWEWLQAKVQEAIACIQFWATSFLRWTLYAKLLSWHVPHTIALVLSQIWPVRWLPAMVLPPPM